MTTCYELYNASKFQVEVEYTNLEISQEKLTVTLEIDERLFICSDSTPLPITVGSELVIIELDSCVDGVCVDMVTTTTTCDTQQLYGCITGYTYEHLDNCPPLNPFGLLCPYPSGNGYTQLIPRGDALWNSNPTIPLPFGNNPSNSFYIPNFDFQDQDYTCGFPGLAGLILPSQIFPLFQGPRFIAYFQINFEGYINIPTTGFYEFEVCSDDGALFTLYTIGTTFTSPTQVPAGASIFSVGNPFQHGFTCVRTTQIQLNSGIYPFTLDYYQGPAYRMGLTLKWITPSNPLLEIIPEIAFINTCPPTPTPYVPTTTTTTMPCTCYQVVVTQNGNTIGGDVIGYPCQYYVSQTITYDTVGTYYSCFHIIPPTSLSNLVTLNPVQYPCQYGGLGYTYCLPPPPSTTTTTLPPIVLPNCGCWTISWNVTNGSNATFGFMNCFNQLQFITINQSVGLIGSTNICTTAMSTIAYYVYQVNSGDYITPIASNVNCLQDPITQEIYGTCIPPTTTTRPTTTTTLPPTTTTTTTCYCYNYAWTANGTTNKKGIQYIDCEGNNTGKTKLQGNNGVINCVKDLIWTSGISLQQLDCCCNCYSITNNSSFLSDAIQLVNCINGSIQTLTLLPRSLQNPKINTITRCSATIPKHGKRTNVVSLGDCVYNPSNNTFGCITTTFPTTTTTTTLPPTTTTTLPPTTTTTTCNCLSVDVYISQVDIVKASGNTLNPQNNGVVAWEYNPCDGNYVGTRHLFLAAGFYPNVACIVPFSPPFPIWGAFSYVNNNNTILTPQAQSYAQVNGNCCLDDSTACKCYEIFVSGESLTFSYVDCTNTVHRNITLVPTPTATMRVCSFYQPATQQFTAGTGCYYTVTRVGFCTNNQTCDTIVPTTTTTQPTTTTTSPTTTTTSPTTTTTSPTTTTTSPTTTTTSPTTTTTSPTTTTTTSFTGQCVCVEFIPNTTTFISYLYCGDDQVRVEQISQNTIKNCVEFYSIDDGIINVISNCDYLTQTCDPTTTTTQPITTTTTRVLINNCDCLQPFIFPATINGITITEVINGDVTTSIGSQVCGCNQMTSATNSTVLGLNSTFDYTLNFSQPVNDVQIMLCQGGYASGFGTENFIFTTNTGTGIPTITSPCECYSTINGNEIISGSISGFNPGSGKFIITNSTPFTSLTVTGNGGYYGTYIWICGDSLFN